MAKTLDDVMALLGQATEIVKGLQAEEAGEPNEPAGNGGPPEPSQPGAGAGSAPLPPPTLGGAPAGAVPTAEKPPVKKPNLIPGQMDSRRF